MADDILLLIGRRIRNLRKSRSITQSTLSERSGISENYLSLIEGGHRSPTLLTLFNISKAMKVSFGELMDISPDKHITSEMKEELFQLAEILKTKQPEDIKMVNNICRVVFKK